MTEPHVPTFPFHPNSARDAFERLRPKIDAVPQDERMRTNVDCGYAVGLGLVLADKLPTYRDALGTLAPHLDLVAIDELRDRALALFYAHSDYLTARTPREPLVELEREARELAKLLMLSGQALKAQGLLPNVRLVGPGARGYLNLAENLNALVVLFHSHWDSIQNKTGIVQAQIDRGAILMQRLSYGSVMADHTPLTPAETTRVRDGAFTLFHRGYDELRRGLTFLYWRTEEVERLAPNLFLRAGSRKPRKVVVASQVESQTGNEQTGS